MNYDIKKDVPPFLLKYDDTSKFLEIFQHGLELIHEDISGYVREFDLETCREEYLDLMLFESGWNLDVELDENLKRKVVKIVYYVYSQKGIQEGIEFAVSYLTGLAIQVNDTVREGFELGAYGYPVTNSLGDDTYLGFDGFYLHFIVHTEPLTTNQLIFVTKIVDFMRWAANTFEIREDLGHGYHEISSSPNEFVATNTFDFSTGVDLALDVEVNSIQYKIVFPQVGVTLWSDVVADIQSALRYETGGLETATIEDNKIRITSATYGEQSTIVISNGTTPLKTDFMSYMDAQTDWNPVFETPVDGGVH